MIREAIYKEEQEAEPGAAGVSFPERREPEESDCADEMSPQPMGEDGETITIQVADGLVTIAKIFMQKYRLLLFRYLKKRLEDGMLERMTGFAFDERRITGQTCTFTSFEQWRIERGYFRFDVHVKLKQRAGTWRSGKS